MLSQTLHATDEVIRDHETLKLNEADWEVFLDALENPPKPNTKLKRAFAEHKKGLPVSLGRFGQTLGKGEIGIE